MGWYRRTKVKLRQQAAPVLRRVLPYPTLTTFSEHLPRVDALPEDPDAPFYLPVRAPEVLERVPSRHHLGDWDRFLAGIRNIQTGLIHETSEVFIAGIPDGRVVSDQILAMSADRHLFRDSSLSEDEFVRKGLDHRSRFPGYRRLEGSYALLGMHWWDCYFHWVFDALPRLAILESVPALGELPLLVPEGLRPNQLESLDRLGVDRDRLVPFAPRHLQVDRLIFPSLPRPSGNPAPWAVEWLRERLLPRDLGPADQLLYISRRDVKRRRLIDEATLEARLADLGFTIVCPGEHTFGEQIELFSRARVVVGAHGSGLTNLLFAPRGATVIELFSPTHLEGCYWALSNVLGMQHGYVIGERVDKDVRVETDRVVELVERVLADVGPRD